MPKMKTYTPANQVSDKIKKAAKRIYDKNPDMTMVQAMNLAKKKAKGA